MFFVFRLFVLSKVIFGVCNVIFGVEIFAPGANVEMLCPHAGGLYHHSPVPVKHGQVKHCKMFLSSYCLFVFSYFFSLFLSFPFFPQSLWNTGKWNTANCFCLLIVFLCFPIFCLFLFLPSPCETMQTVLSSHCLFVCLSFPILSSHPLWTTNGKWNTASGILSFHFCLDVFLSPRFFAFCSKSKFNHSETLRTVSGRIFGDFLSFAK